MTPKLERLLDAVTTAQRELAIEVAHRQKLCKHTKLAECDYLPSKGYGGTPPMRVCLACGISEEGWGSGFYLLRPRMTPAVISRDQLYRLRLGVALFDHHRGPLLRKETTVREMIDSWLKDQLT